MEAIFAVTPSETIKYASLNLQVMSAHDAKFSQNEAYRRRQKPNTSLPRVDTWDYSDCTRGRSPRNIPWTIPCGMCLLSTEFRRVLMKALLDDAPRYDSTCSTS